MTDLATLRSETLAAIVAAPDEAALESVRVAAVGKKGAISLLLATLGKMSPDERKAQGAAINALKDAVSEALAARRAVLKSAARHAQLQSETLDVTLPARSAGIETGRIHPISQVLDEVTMIFVVNFDDAPWVCATTDATTIRCLDFLVGAHDGEGNFRLEENSARFTL